MPAYDAPGVHVEEVELGAAPPVGGEPSRRRRRLGATVVGASETTLSLAVRLEDPDTGASPSPVDAPGLSLSIEGFDAEPVFHRSGYALFLDLPEESVTLLVDGGARYRDESHGFDLSDQPVVEERTLEHADDTA